MNPYTYKTVSLKIIIIIRHHEAGPGETRVSLSDDIEMKIQNKGENLHTHEEVVKARSRFRHNTPQLYNQKKSFGERK